MYDSGSVNYDALDPTYNEISGGAVYPQGGSTIGTLGGDNTPRTFQGQASTTPAAQGYTGNPIVGLVVFIVLVALLMFTAQKMGSDGDFKNIKASFYNVLLISLVAVIGIPVWKMAFSALAGTGMPGADHVREWTLAA